MSRRLSLFLLTAIFGGGWYYLGAPGLPPDFPFGQQPGGHQQHSGGYSSTGQFPASPVATQSPATFGRQAGTVSQPGGPTIRIASFNIQVFGTDKVEKKPYVAAELGRVIQRFHLVAIQEIRSKDDYLLDRFLRDHVNVGGRYYDYVIGPRLGRSNSKEQYAFIFDTSAIEVNRQGIYTINDPQDRLHREPLVALFRVRGPPPYEAFTFLLVNIHTDPDEVPEEVDALADVYHAVRQASGGEDDIIILGDLNADDRHLGRLGQIPGIRPIVRGVFTNTRQNRLYDNIIVHQQSTAEFTGQWGVYDLERLHNLNRDQALMVSDHLPVWAEFSAYEAAAPGRVANRGGAAAAAGDRSAR